MLDVFPYPFFRTGTIKFPFWGGTKLDANVWELERSPRKCPALFRLVSFLPTPVLSRRGTVYGIRQHPQKTTEVDMETMKAKDLRRLAEAKGPF